MWFLWSSMAFAQSQAQGVAKPSTAQQLIPFLFMGLIFYFLLIRPQSKKAKLHRDFLTQMKRGDKVLTSSGILGTIEGLTDDFVTLNVAEGVNLRVLKSQIASAMNEGKNDRK